MGIPYDKKTGGSRLCRMRHDRNLTLEQLGEKLDRSAAAVCAYEKGYMGLTYEMAVRYADAFGMSLDDLTAILSAPPAESGAIR